MFLSLCLYEISADFSEFHPSAKAKLAEIGWNFIETQRKKLKYWWNLWTNLTICTLLSKNVYIHVSASSGFLAKVTWMLCIMGKQVRSLEKTGFIKWKSWKFINNFTSPKNTRHKNNLRPIASSTTKGLLRSQCSFIRDWNALPVHVWEIETLAQFHRVLPAELLGF